MTDRGITTTAACRCEGYSDIQCQTTRARSVNIVVVHQQTDALVLLWFSYGSKSTLCARKRQITFLLMSGFVLLV